MKFFIAVLLSTLLFPYSSNAETSSEKESFSDSFLVQLIVEGEETLQERIASYVSHELRQLGDVRETSENPEMTINILAMEIHNNGGDEVGIAISTVVSQPFPKWIFKYIEKPVQSFFTEDFLFSDGLFDRHYLMVGSSENLKELCAMIVADFDRDCIEPNRELMHKVEDWESMHKLED